MDAVKYIKEKERMCKGGGIACEQCPLSSAKREENLSCSEYVRRYTEEAVSLVEKWSKEHPIVRNWQKFQEVFGTAIDPVTATVDWWSAEYKEPKGEEDGQ